MKHFYTQLDVLPVYLLEIIIQNIINNKWLARMEYRAYSDIIKLLFLVFI